MLDTDTMRWTTYEVVCNDSQDRFPMPDLDTADKFMDVHEQMCDQGHVVYRLVSSVEFATEGTR